MGDSKLCLLLLLSTSALTLAHNEDLPTCLLAQRYKTLHKYEYQYVAESLNGINGASALKNGPKASCKVEIEVPQTCSFILRTTGCSLSEVVDMDAAGHAVFGPAPTSDAFAAEMERHPLRFVVEGEHDVKLYPEEGETSTILNLKRGIISALAVPAVEEQKNKNMPTIHGLCKTSYTVNHREDIATDVSLRRDLSTCDKFSPLRGHTSSLALISGMHYPLAQLIRSSQTCHYKFDNEKKHMISGSCVENHILIPFSHKGEYGVTNVGKQELTLVLVSPHNDRVFNRGAVAKGLHMEAVEDRSIVQDKDAALQLLRELAHLPEAEGERRAQLFHKLVHAVRGMKADTLSAAVTEAIAVSRVLTYQVLAQCGTPECSSGIMQILRQLDSSSVEVDAAVFAMGLVSNPSALLIHDMLEMAKYKASKPIMYALSNVVKRFYKAEEKMIPEIHSVAEFMAAQLGHCSGDEDKTFLTLRVIGNMAAAVVPASPALKTAVMQCMNEPAASQAVQQAAIQVYRLAPVPEEAREILMNAFLDHASPLQKRIAAYLILMKNPTPSELVKVAEARHTEQDKQIKSFVNSHMANILTSTEPETQELREKILDALQNNGLESAMDPTKFSRNYKIGSVEGNMIFEGSHYLPKEAMLEMTLKAFGFDIDMMEIGMEGTGFEPTVDALFGKNGFFPDTVMKSIYFVSDNMPLRVNEIMQSLMPALKKDRMKRQTTQNLMREIGHNLKKLMSDLETAQAPEAMVYLRLLGNELGYLKTKEMEEMAYSAVMMIDSMLKMFPVDLMKALMTKADNTIFAHYIFMDNEFFLPTVTGVPLRIALSGTFTPGVKGGLKVARDMTEVAFMPSAGIEFVTEVGCHIPEYVDSGLEMHTNIFHESGLDAKISMGRDSIKMSIPAPKSPTKLIKMTNSLVAVTGSERRTIPPMVMDKVDVRECTPVFAGMKYCTDLQYIDAFSQDTSPYFPFTGDSKFVVELHPTGEVTEYTATVAYELLLEGDAKHKVDSVKFTLRAEAAEPTEANAVLKYNRRKHVISADIQIPDYDVEAGFRLGVVDGNTKGKGTHSISLDFVNKNVPQLSLVGRANLKTMNKGMLQVQLRIPSILTDATVTANMKRGEWLELELKNDVKFLDSTVEQKVALIYDASKIEVDFKSDVIAATSLMPLAPDMFEKYTNQILDIQVGQTDMKVRHIFRKFVEAANNHMEKYGADMPYIQNFRLPEMPEITLPETLFFNHEAKAVYYFNNERFTIAIPVPLGGKSTEELNFPSVLTTPRLSLPRFGLEIVSMEIPIPNLVVPESLALSLPLFNKAEVSSLLKTNLYEAEASFAVGKDVVETPSYSAKFDIKGTSPIEILSMEIKGSGMVATTDSVKANLKTSLSHKFIEASIDITEDVTLADKLTLRSDSKIEATSTFGLNFDLVHTGMAGINTEEISGDGNFEGKFKAGPMFGKTISTQSFTISPFKPEAKIDSTLEFDSTFVKARNTIAVSLADSEFSVVSKTNAFDDVLTHVAELSVKDYKLSMKSDANAVALGMKIHNQADASAGASEIVLRMETNADHTENRVYSLLTASLDVNGLAVNSDATVKLLENEATHKAILRMNKEGLTTSGTTTLQSPLSLENTFNAGLDASRATLSITNKAAIRDIKFDNTNAFTMTVSGLDINSKVEATASEYASYTHDVTVDVKPYTLSANVNNKLNLLAANFLNEAHLQAELFKMDLTGNMKAMYGEEEIKHTYQVHYADMAANAKCNTIGKLFGTHMSHNTEVEIIGLAARITNDARFNSQPMRFDHTIRCSIVPFDFNLDAIFNADADFVMYGKHSSQLYGKFLLKAQPLAFASTHECRASVTHKLDNDFSLEATFDNNMNTVLLPQEQRASFRMSSKMNEQVFTEGISLYNSAERAGVEVSGTILTNMLNTESADNQEFTISGFLKYDKNTDSHTIQIPLIENLPAFLESMKGVVVRVAEALQDLINNKEMQAKLEALPQQMRDFVSQLNIEARVTQLKQFFSDFTQTYAISMEDVEATLTNLKDNVRKMLGNLTFIIQKFTARIKELIVDFAFPEDIIQKIQEHLNAFNEEYDIKAMVVYVIDTVMEMFQHIDLEKLKGSSIAFLHDIDNQINLISNVRTMLIEIKRIIERFDFSEFVAELKRFFLSLFNFNPEIRRFFTFYTKLFTDTIDTVMEVIQDLDMVSMINKFLTKMRDLTVKFEVDQMAQRILENAVELIKQFRIEENIQAVVTMVKDANIPARCMQAFHDAIEYLKATEVKDMITQLNVYIETTVQKLNSLKYNEFVDYTNEMITEYTDFVNELIRTLEITQKLEKTREFVNTVFLAVSGIMERLREIKVAEVMKSVKDIIDEVVLNNLKTFFDYVKEEIKDMDVKAIIAPYLNRAIRCYRFTVSIVTDIIHGVAMMIQEMMPEQKIFSEIKQISVGLTRELKKAEWIIPSFTVPFTDLTVSSWVFSLDKLGQFPTQLDIPEFNILGSYHVHAMTVSFDDIKQRIINLIDMILNFEFQMPDMDAYFGDLKLNYLPSMPELSLPEFTLPEFSFPAVPHVSVEKLVKSLQVPEIKLPAIPSDIMVPCFGKLYSEIKFVTPFYTIKTNAEFENTTQNLNSPQFSGFLTSQATSPSFDILNYKLDTTARIAIPKFSRVVLAETLKFDHLYLGVNHQASVTLYGLSGQAQAKTTLKATTEPYTAEFTNTAFIAIEEGMTASLDTTYVHEVNIPIVNIRSVATVTQKSIVRQDGLTLTLSVDNAGTGKIQSEDVKHKSNLNLSLTPRMVTLTFSGETDCPIMKMKQEITAECSTLSYFKFNVRNEAEAPVIKNSLLVASGYANLYDMKIELKANHDTELHGAVSTGVMSNGINIVVHPFEIVFDFQNRGSAKLYMDEDTMTKMEVQNDYSALFKPDSQQVNTVALARLDQYKMSYNVTVNNNKNEAGIFVALDGEANLDFLKSTVTIPEFKLPFVNMRTPSLIITNLYERAGLENILTTTQQTVDVDAKVVYQKSHTAPLVAVMDLFQIPSMGNLISELSFKSAIINLNVNAGLYAEDDLVFRLGATTVSVFDALKAKLDGTTSLTTKRGIKLANSVSLENRHIEGTHDSSITVNTETYEPSVSVATNGKISLPILSMEVNQNLVADIKTKANAASTLRMKADFNIPMIMAVGKAEADHSLKLEGNFEYISMESTTRATVDKTLLEDYLLIGLFDNEFNMYLNTDGLRSTHKIITDAKFNHGTNKIFGLDVNENLAIEASLTRVYGVLKYISNNEANMFSFQTTGKHSAQMTIDVTPMSSWIADIEIDIAQPSSLGDLTIFDKSVVEMTLAKQKISSNAKFVSPLYSTNLLVEFDGVAPVFKVTIKSSATSVIVFLQYDLDASTTVNFEEDALKMISKLSLTHSDLLMDVNQVITQILRKKRQADNSASRHTLNVDITSPTFTDVNLRYAARRDSISASVSTPSTGFLGFQLNRRGPSQMTAKVYGRYPSAPEVDVDVMVIKSSSKGADKMNVQIAYNMEAPKLMLSGLKTRLPSIMSAFTMFADKYQITSHAEQLKAVFHDRMSKTRDAILSYDDQMSQLSVFFKNTVVEYQKNVQVLLDAVVRILRETKFKLPSSDEMTTLPEVLKKLTSSIAAMLDSTINCIYEKMVYYSAFLEDISAVKLQMPIGDAITIGQIVDQVKTTCKRVFAELVDLVKKMESLDTMLEKIGETFHALVETSKVFVDSVKSDYLDAVFVNINDWHRYLVRVMGDVVYNVYLYVLDGNIEPLNHAFENMIHVVDEFNNTVHGLLKQTSEEVQAYVRVSEGKLEVDLPFTFQL